MKKILIIEDNPMVANALDFKLSKMGYRIITASDGREAKRIIETDQFDLIITDLMLPFISGTELIEHIKKLNHDLPIIVLSTSNQEEIIMNAFQLGVEDFITKPFSPNELLLRVKRIIS
ncbi:response regulator transcription factor [Mesonia sp. K7]|uniref:response regulator transcription factor n=1 Tax=Mesonia sp. K7 TaxID=2218606 RepID=UPI000DAA2997|nr:response regulator transcription factor [Mesonia sp. K7]PZD76759.1 response regulator [Mesonia sp. K7]